MLVTAEIFLICANVTRTNVAWTNVTPTVGICFIKIGSVRAEIFLIWTNVARTNVSWTNVNMTVGISSRCFQQPTVVFWVWQWGCPPFNQAGPRNLGHHKKQATNEPWFFCRGCDQGSDMELLRNQKLLFWWKPWVWPSSDTLKTDVLANTSLGIIGSQVEDEVHNREIRIQYTQQK